MEKSIKLKLKLAFSARISANFPTGNGLKEFSFLKSAGQIRDNSRQSIPSVPNCNLMFNKISIICTCIAFLKIEIAGNYLLNMIFQQLNEKEVDKYLLF